MKLIIMIWLQIMEMHTKRKRLSSIDCMLIAGEFNSKLFQRKKLELEKKLSSFIIWKKFKSSFLFFLFFDVNFREIE